MLCCFRQNVASRSREVIFPLYSVLLNPHLEYCVQFWSAQYRRGMDILKGPQKWTKNWSIFPMKDKESWDCLSWRKLEEISSMYINNLGKMQKGWRQSGVSSLFSGALGTGPEAVGINWKKTAGLVQTWQNTVKVAAVLHVVQRGWGPSPPRR